MRLFSLDSLSLIRQLDLHENAISDFSVLSDSTTVLSADRLGNLELFDLETEDYPSEVEFKYKSVTDLLKLVETKDFAETVTFSKTGAFFGLFTNQKRIYVFSAKTAKIIFSCSEALVNYQKNLDTLITNEYYSYDKVNFLKKINNEKELLRDWQFLPAPKIEFDETDTYVFFPTIVGIKQVNIKQNSLTQIIGLPEEKERFLTFTLLQTKPEKVNK